MPPAGSQPSATANSMISRMASQKGGTEMPAKAKVDGVCRAARAAGRSAATCRAGRASARASAKESAHQQGGVARRGSSTSMTGRACMRE